MIKVKSCLRKHHCEKILYGKITRDMTKERYLVGAMRPIV